MSSHAPFARLRLASLVAATIAASACGPFHRGSQSDAYVQFVNQSADQADVYAIPVAGDPIRIGTVYAGHTTQLTLPTTAIGGDGMVNIVARIFASNRAPRTGRVALMAGQSIQVTLTPEENTLAVLPGASQ